MAQECGNPLLLGWLKEWLDEARERNSKGVLTYKKAYESMKACPITFAHPSEATQLHGLGPKLCDRLTAKLIAHCQENDLPVPEPPNKGKKRASGDAPPGQAEAPSKKARKKKAYVPALRSGAYAILVALSTVPETSSIGLTKNEIIDTGQEHCDSSFTAPSDPTKFHTAWNSMKTLQNKDLVYEVGRPTKRYSLTEDGWVTAKQIRKANSLGGGGAVDNDAGTVDPQDFNRNAVGPLDGLMPMPELQEPPLAMQDQSPPASPSRRQQLGVSTHFNPICIPVGAFTVELILDNREVRAKTDQSYIQNTLVSHGVAPTTRSLSLGDALWVARLKPEFTYLLDTEIDDDKAPCEIMLSHIVERKRLDDLIGSIKDGRFHEQKFRLRRSGVPNVTYIIEDIALAPEVARRSADMVSSAIAGTMVVGNFFVKRTRKLDETISYLARMTKLLRKKFESRALEVVPNKALGDGRDVNGMRNLLRDESKFITFSTFASLAGKNDSLTLRDVFLKMLMCTKGITSDKALEIQRRWKTPRAFIEALQREEEKEGGGGGPESERRRREMVFRVAGQLVGRKQVGKAVSARVCDVWGES